MNARDIMSAPVISVGPQTPVLQVAALLREQRIGGVPVLEGNELVGIVTEKDLLHRQEIGTEERGEAQPWWRRILVSPTAQPDGYIKSHGRCARHVMTRKVIAVAPETGLREITALFRRHRIGRVPVVRDGHLVGIVACADLVKALAEGRWSDRPAPAPRTADSEIRRALLAELDRQEWWNRGLCDVEVRAGVVRFTGFVENDSHREASRVAAENTPGVRRVDDRRRWLAELPTMF